MKIVHINYPHVITDTGNKIPIVAIEGNPKVGSELHLQKGSVPYKITAVTSDSECVGGVCPVK